MENDRGSYGDQSTHGGGGGIGIGIMVGLVAVIYGLSPGARHFYRHGRLPPAESTAQWRPRR